LLDGGLLFSAGAVLVVLLILGRTRHPEEPAVADVAFWPAAFGLLVGRLVALGLDDPESLRSMSNLLLLRGGVELWPGVAAGTLTALALPRLQARSLQATARVLVPAAVAAWATYDVACLFRDGCPGPASPVGLRPSGLTSTQLPVSLVAGLLGLGAAVVLRRAAPRCTTAGLIFAGLFVVSSLRSLESIWLPSLGGGLSRQWSQSIAVLAVAGIGLVTLGVKRTLLPARSDKPQAEPDPTPDDPPARWAARLDRL